MVFIPHQAARQSSATVSHVLVARAASDRVTVQERFATSLRDQ
jgi:hypothetical protein